MLYSSLHIHHLRNKGTKEVGGIARRRLFHFYSAQSGHAGTVSWKTNAHRIPVSASFLPQILISPLDTFHVFSPLLSFTRCSSNNSRPASLGRDPQSQASKAKQSIMSSGFKLVAITVLLFAPLDTLAGRIYHRDDDPQMSLSKFHESQHLLNLVLISWLRQPSIPRLSNPPASSLAWKTVGIPTRMPH